VLDVCNLHCDRYKLLLTDLLKNTLPDDDDYAALTGTSLLKLDPAVNMWHFISDYVFADGLILNAI